MYLPRAQRKLILLYAQLDDTAEKKPRGGSKLYRELQKGGEVFVAAGPDGTKTCNVEELEDYRAARSPQKTKTLLLLDQFARAAFPELREWQHPVSDDGIKVFDFGDKIGLKFARARYIIDHLYASELPTYSAVAQSASSASRFTEKHGGLYWLYRHDVNPEACGKGHAQGIVTRSALSIRYPVPYKPHKSDRKGGSRIRCKLAIPAYGNGGGDPIKYDGYVGVKGRWQQFLLQARPSSRKPRKSEDLILMYTERLPLWNELRVVRGVMLTQNQERESLTPTVSTVALVRAPGYFLWKPTALEGDYYRLKWTDSPRRTDISDKNAKEVDEHDFMHGSAVVVPPGPLTKLVDHDQRGIRALFAGWSEVNTRGLHI